jgi:hypothetical protein
VTVTVGLGVKVGLMEKVTVWVNVGEEVGVAEGVGAEGMALNSLEALVSKPLESTAFRT